MYFFEFIYVGVDYEVLYTTLYKIIKYTSRIKALLFQTFDYFRRLITSKLAILKSSSVLSFIRNKVYYKYPAI